MAEIEVKPPKAAFYEKGYVADSSGGPGWPQWVQDERVPDLQWPESVQTFGRMLREDSRVSSLYAAITLPIRRTPWRIAANGARDEVVEFVAKNFNLPIEGGDNLPQPTRTKGKFSWVQHLQQALTALPYGHCVDYDTEVLTTRGWLSGAALQPGDQILTISPTTGLAEWQPCETVHRWDGPQIMRVLDSRSHSSVTTLNHKWITRAHDTKALRFRTSAELNTNDRILRAAPVATLPSEPKWSDAFVELVGWYWTDGHEHRTGGASVYQSQTVNPENCQRIRAALTALYGPARESLRHGRGPALRGWRESRRPREPHGRVLTSWYLDAEAAEPLRSVAPGGCVSGEFVASLTASQLRLFVETSIDANGTRGRRGGLAGATIYQQRADRLDSFEMACSLLGLPWTRFDAASGQATRVGTQTEIRPVHSAHRRDNERATDTTSVVDGVWCPQVPNRTWLARRRGTVYFTGNSVFEQTYWPPDANDRYYLRKLAPRPQRTISNWNVALDGGLMSIEQFAPASNGVVKYGIGPLKINIGRLVVYSRDQDPGVWWGNSLLRPSYKHWLLKDELIRYQAVAIRRMGMGVPVATAAPGATQEDVDKLAEMAQQYRGGDTSGVGLPHDADLKLVTPNGTVIDIGAAIAYHDNMIAIAGLAHFLNLEGGGGSYALASVQEHTFTQSVQTTAEWIRDTATAHIVEDLVDINFGVDEPSPRLVFDEIGSRRDLTEAGLKMLVEAGLLSPDVLVEQTVRQRLGLPAKPADAPTEPVEPNLGVAS